MGSQAIEAKKRVLSRKKTLNSYLRPKYMTRSSVNNHCSMLPRQLDTRSCICLSNGLKPSTSKMRYQQLWSSFIPLEILELILEKLTCAADCIRFGAVCKLWRSALCEAKHRLTPSVPLILLLPPAGDPTNRELVDLTTPTTRFYKLPSDPDKKSIVVGSSFGWLVTMDPSICWTCLFNPITGAHIKLPPAAWLVGFRNEKTIPFKKFVYKAVLSSVPNSGCIVMAIYGREQKISFCRIGDEKWTRIPVTEYFCKYQDVIYHKGQFYAVTDAGEDGEEGAVVVFELDPIPKVTEVAPIPNETMTFNKYLVESSGMLLLVTRFLNEYDNNWVFRTTSFEIHRLHVTASEKWEEITSLPDQVLFLGRSGSISLSADEAHGCKPNHIYFLDDNCDWCMEPLDIGVYHIEDVKSKIKPPYSLSRSWPLPTFWFTPAPW